MENMSLDDIVYTDEYKDGEHKGDNTGVVPLPDISCFSPMFRNTTGVLTNTLNGTSEWKAADTIVRIPCQSCGCVSFVQMCITLK